MAGWTHSGWNSALVGILAAGIAIRLVVAVVLAFVDFGDPSLLDARSFHATAQVISHNWSFKLAIDYELYTNLLGLVYAGAGDHWLVGNLTSVAGYAVFLVILYRITAELGLSRREIITTLLVVLLPAGVLYTSTTLRESWQLLALAWMVLGLLRWSRDNQITGLVHLAAGALILALSHKALIVYAAVFVAAVSAAALYKGRRSSNGWMPGALPVIMLVVVTGSVIAAGWYRVPGSGLIYGFAEQGLLVQIEEYRSVIEQEQPRSAFDTGIDSSSYLALMKSLGDLYVRYMFGPSPLHAHGLKDWYAVGESLLRVVFLAAWVTAMLRSGPAHRRVGIILGLVYFSLTLFWTLGTTNYGQAVRHHVLTNWLLFLMGGSMLTKWLQKLVPIGANRAGA